MGYRGRLHLITLALALPLAFAEAGWAADLRRDALHKLEITAGSRLEGLDMPAGLRSKQNSDVDSRQAEADRLLGLGIEQYKRSDWRAALATWQQALVIYQDIGNRAGEAKALNNLGAVHQFLGEYREALEQYEQSLVITREIGNRTGEAITLNNIGEINRLLGQYSEALEYYEQSLIITQEIGDRSGEAQTLTNIGKVNSLLGQYSKALEQYEQSLIIIREIGNRALEAQTLTSIGLVHNSLGEYREALEQYGQSLVITREIGDRAVEANTFIGLGSVHRKLGEYREALEQYERSLMITREIGDRSGEANTFIGLGSLNAQLENYSEALNHYEQSLVIAQEIGARSTEIEAVWGIALIAGRINDYDTAFDTYQKALVISRELKEIAPEADILTNLGYLFEENAQPELAIVFFKQAVNTYERIRTNIQSLDSNRQQSFTTTVEATYRHLADLLLQQDRVIEAQRVLDLLRVQELDGYLRGVRRTEDTEAGAEYLQSEAVITADYNQLVDRAVENGIRLRELQNKNTLTSEEEQLIDQLLDEEQDIRKAFANFIKSDLVQAELAKLSLDETERNLQLSQLNGLQDNLKDLEQDAVLLYPFILEDRLELILVTPYNPPIRRTISVGRQEINKAVGQLRIALENPGEDAKTPASTLYDWLIAPIKEDLEKAGAETIIYTPDRTLRYIPLATLYNAQTDKWLIQDYAVNNITAASLTDFNTKPQESLEILAGAFASGSHDVTIGQRDIPFKGLPYAGVEVNNLQDLVPDMTLLLDDSFSRSAVRREANRHTLVHLATHAKFLVGTPDESFILFGNGERVTLADLKEGWLTLTQVDLFVLSACETGVSNSTYTNKDNGEEILGFGYLMQEAGARASMASLWSVDDGGTQVLMNAFYDTLVRGGLSKANALQLAQKQMIRLAEDNNRGGLVNVIANSDLDIEPTGLSHPHYWAPFVLIGNGL